MTTTLIVDDSATSRMVLKVYLQAGGQTDVLDAADKNEALRKAEKHNPKVVFMDYNLEDANGVELAIAMQQQGLEAKFILLTGDLQESIIDVARQAGFHDVLQKPVSQGKIEEIYVGL